MTVKWEESHLQLVKAQKLILTDEKTREKRAHSVQPSSMRGVRYQRAGRELGKVKADYLEM